jgi:hypothetical protein
MASSNLTPDTQQSHQFFVTVLLEFMGVLAMTIIADVSDDVGNVLMVVMIGFFIIFLMNNLGPKTVLV